MLFVHSMDLQPFALVLSQDLVLFVHSLDLQPLALVLSKDLVLFVHSMDKRLMPCREEECTGDCSKRSI